MICVKSGLELLGRSAGKSRAHKGGEQVIDHVYATKARAHAHGLIKTHTAHVEGDAPATDFDASGTPVKLGTAEVSLGATEGAQLGVGAVVIGELRAANLAEARLGHAVRRQVEVLADAKRQHLGAGLTRATRDAHNEGIVATGHERGLRRDRKRGDDDVLDALDLAGAVELIAEEVQEHEVAWVELGQDVDRGELIRLHDGPVGRAAGKEGRRDARSHVGANAVAQNAGATCLDSTREHVVRGRLAVGSTHDDGTLRELFGGV